MLTAGIVEQFAPRSDFRAPCCVSGATKPSEVATKTLRAQKHLKPRQTPPGLEHSPASLCQCQRGPWLMPSMCPFLRAALQPPSPMQTKRRQPPALCRHRGPWEVPHRAGDCPGHPEIAGPPRTHRAAGHAPASMQRRAETACSSLRSPAPGLPLPCAPGAATNLRRSRRSRWSRFPRGCWSCRHRAPSPRALRP